MPYGITAIKQFYQTAYCGERTFPASFRKAAFTERYGHHGATLFSTIARNDSVQPVRGTGLRCRGLYQRNRRDIPYASDGVPGFPTSAGSWKNQNVQITWQPLCLSTQSWVLGTDPAGHASRAKRYRKVYQAKSGYWYYNITGQDGRAERQVLYLEGYPSKEKILEHMKRLRTDYCILRCEMEGKQYEKRCD